MDGSHHKNMMWSLSKHTPGGSEDYHAWILTWTPLCDAFSHAGTNSVCTQNFAADKISTDLSFETLHYKGIRFIIVMYIDISAAAWLAFPTGSRFEWTKRWTAFLTKQHQASSKPPPWPAVLYLSMVQPCLQPNPTPPNETTIVGQMGGGEGDR